MLDKIFIMTIESVLSWKKKTSSFEYNLYYFHKTLEFECLCDDFLPSRLAQYQPGCVLLFISLSRMHSEWLKDALLESRKERTPVLFKKGGSTCLTGVEENNKVDRFLGWSIFSTKKLFKWDRDEGCIELLSAMIAWERYWWAVDGEVLWQKYDTIEPW